MPKIKPTILGNLKGMILTSENTLILKSRKYPNGGKFLITGTERTIKGWSHQLTDVQTGKRVVKDDGDDWFDVADIEKMKIKKGI